MLYAMLIDQKWKAAWSEIKSCQNVLHIKSKLFRFFRCFEVLFQAFAVKTVEKSLHMQPLFVSVQARILLVFAPPSTMHAALDSWLFFTKKRCVKLLLH